MVGDEVKTAVQAYAKSGLIVASFSPEFGGMHLPSCVNRSIQGFVSERNAYIGKTPK